MCAQHKVPTTCLKAKAWVLSVTTRATSTSAVRSISNNCSYQDYISLKNKPKLMSLKKKKKSVSENVIQYTS